MKKLMWNPLRRLLSIALILLLLSACGTAGDNPGAPDSVSSSPVGSSDPSGAAQTDPNAENLAAEQVLNLVYVETVQWDINAAATVWEIQVLKETGEGLFRTFTDENGIEVVENAGCTGYDISDDGLVYTFHLREDSVWSDGVPVTAQNYVDSWLRLIDPNETFTYATKALSIAGAEAYYYGEGSVEDVGIELVNDYTFRVTLAAPDTTFLDKINMVYFYPIRKDLIDAAEAANQDWAHDYTLHVFNGPFVISDYVSESSITLTKNENYYDADSVYLTQINFRDVEETSTQALLIESQELDILTISDLEYIQQWQPLVDNGTLVHTVVTKPVIQFLLFEQNVGGLSGVMQSEKVRLAMSLAIDREEYVSLFLEGYFDPAYALIPNGVTSGETEYRGCQDQILLEPEYVNLASDPAALRALFEEGCREAGYTGDIADLSLEIMKYNPTVLDSNKMEWYKQQFESKLGCQVNVHIYPDLSGEQAARANFEYDFKEQGWDASYNDPLALLELFISDGSYAGNLGHFSNEEYDSLVAQIRVCQDETERLELIAQAERILMENAGVAPLYYQQDHLYYQSYIKDLSLLAFGTAPYEFIHTYIAEH